MKKLLSISSPGGHWVQLCRLIPAFDASEVVYCCTYDRPTELSSDESYIQIEDVSRQSLSRLPRILKHLFFIIRTEKPTTIITTGAFPGLLALVIGRLLGINTIWLDSIANSEQLSGSGKLASYIAHHCFTQWEGLTNRRVRYIGRVI